LPKCIEIHTSNKADSGFFKETVPDNVHALITGKIPLPQKMKGVCPEFCASIPFVVVK
jgi:hypothetical protein